MLWINERYNVSYNDINALACMVLRHRIKANFEAITEHITTDDIINNIIKELNVTGEYKVKDTKIINDEVETETRKAWLFSKNNVYET